MAEASPNPTDRRLRQLHNQAAATLARADFLHRRLRAELLSRLDFAALEPGMVLDLGAGPGEAAGGLSRRFPGAQVLALDHAHAMLQAGAKTTATRLCADARQLPLADHSVDLVFCNLLLAYCPDPVPVLTEVRRVLRTPGLFVFSTLGPDTLVEIRTAWEQADEHTHVVRFPDMHDLGDLIVHAGLAEPVLDRETLSITYADIGALRADLRAAGSINRTGGRNPGLTGRAAAQKFRAALARTQGEAGRLSVSAEVVFGQAWAGPVSAGRKGLEVSIPSSQIGRRRT